MLAVLRTAAYAGFNGAAVNSPRRAIAYNAVTVAELQWGRGEFTAERAVCVPLCDSTAASMGPR